jgi:hypothetical protein
MSTHQQQDREVLLANVDLRELLDDIGAANGLASRGKMYPCPSAQHGGQTGGTPPVSVNSDPGGYEVWRCHACGAGGTALDVLLTSGRAPDLSAAFEQLGARKCDARPMRRESAPPRVLPEEDYDPIPRPVLDRIAARKGWSEATLSKLGVAWDPGRKRFAIPVRNGEGRLVGMVRYQPGGDPKMRADSGTERTLFPAPESLEGDEVWIVEGEPDALSAHEMDLPAVGIPGVESWKPEWAQRFTRFSRAIVCGDCDQKGRDMARRVAADLAVAGIEACVLDIAPEREDHYDIGDLLVENLPDRDGAAGWLRDAAAYVKPLPVVDVMFEQEVARLSTSGLPITLPDAADLITKVETEVPAVWGRHPHVLWAKGEPFMIAGATGTGKTTLAQQVVMRMVSVLKTPLLGQPVEDDGRAVMYLALDRDQQAQRSLRRMTASLPPGRLLWVSDLGDFKPTRHDPAVFVDWLRLHRVGHVVLDSLYGMLATGKDEEKLDWYSKLLRKLAAQHINIMVLHHFRKGNGADDGGPLIDRVYGGMQVTASAGSVLALSGEPGDKEIEAFHVKQPAEVCGPWTLKHDHGRGTTASAKHPTPMEYLRDVGHADVDEVMEACHLASAKRARKLLEAQVEDGNLLRSGDVYRLADPHDAEFARMSSKDMDDIRGGVTDF